MRANFGGAKVNFCYSTYSYAVCSHMKKFWFTLVIFICVVLNACSQPGNSQTSVDEPPPTDEVYIQTDSPIYTPIITGQIASFDVTATFTNKQVAPLYIATCEDTLPFFSLQKYTNNTWLEVREMIGTDCAGELNLNEVELNQKLSKTFPISFLLPYETSGFYRLRWDSVFPEANVNTESIPEIQRVSNYFEVK